MQAQHYDSLQRLRGEMMVEYGQRQERRQHNAALAAQQQQQAEEKKARDVQGRKVAGINHWPFRTEEQVQAQVDAANSKQKVRAPTCSAAYLPPRSPPALPPLSLLCALHRIGWMRSSSRSSRSGPS